MELQPLLSTESYLSWQGTALLILIFLPIFIARFISTIPRDLLFTIAALLSGLTGIVPSAHLYHAAFNQAIITVFGVWLIGKAMQQQGLFHACTAFLLSVKKEGYLGRFIFFCQTLLLGAFLQHRYFPLSILRTCLRIAEKQRGDLSIYGFPFAYLFLIGGLATAIGTPTNILFISLYSLSTGNVLTDFFIFLPLSIPPVFVSAIALLILKKQFHKPFSWFIETAACAVVPPDSLFIGREVPDIIVREGRPMAKKIPLQSGDLIIFNKTPQRSPLSQYAFFNHIPQSAARVWKKIIVILSFIGAIISTFAGIPIGMAFFVAGLIALCIRSFPIRKTFQEDFPLPSLLEIFSAYLFFLAMQNSGLNVWLASFFSINTPFLLSTLFFVLAQIASHFMPRPIAFSILFSIAAVLFSAHPAQLMLMGINIAFAAALPLFGKPLLDETALSTAISGKTRLSIRILLVLILFATVTIPICLVWPGAS